MIELEKVTSGYGKKNILHSASVRFEKGKLTSIIGINGCGKSTLLKAAIGVLPHSSGIIRVDGIDITSLKDKERAKKIAYLAQGKNAPDMTVGEMVLHGRFPHLTYPQIYSAEDRRIAFEAMERMSISKLCDVPVSSLSGGIRQKAFVAMALAQKSDYILLDEPTTFLDISHQLELMKVLRELACSDRGIVTVMHDLPMAFKYSDIISVMCSGEVCISDTPEAICSSGIIKEIFGVSVFFDKNDQSYRYDL